MSPCKLLPFCVALALTGCSLAPDYQRPAMPVPQQFSLSQNGLVNAADNYQNAGWRTFFVDNQVKTLISEALVNNRDLRMADAPRDKCTLSCAINGIHAAFHYLKKNYISGCVMTVPTGW